MRAVRDAETASVSIGPVDPTLIHTTAFGISAAVTAAHSAGGVYASISQFHQSLNRFPFFQSILFLLVVMLGGADRVLGPLIGACVVVLLPELLATLGQYRLLFVGVLMLAVLRSRAPSVWSASSPNCFHRRRFARQSRENDATSNAFSPPVLPATAFPIARSGGEFRRRARGQGPELGRASRRCHQHHWAQWRG